MKKSPDSIFSAALTEAGSFSVAMEAAIAVGRSPVLDAIRALDGFLAGRGLAASAFRLSEIVKGYDGDPDTAIVLFSVWARGLARNAGDLGEDARRASALLQRANALIGPATHASIASFVSLARAELAARAGNRMEEERRLIEAATLRPPGTALRRDAVVEAIRRLAQAGRLSEAGEWAEDRLFEADPAAAGDVAVARIVDAAECGRVGAARSALSALPGGLSADASRIAAQYALLIEFMTPDPTPGAVADVPADLPDWALTLRCLLNQSPQQAMRWARFRERRVPSALNDRDCMAFNLLRAELAEGNAEAARRLVELRQARGNAHFLDSFFLARVEWLEGHAAAAGEHFRRTLEEADRLSAQGRVEFELRMASELPRDAILRLARPGGRVVQGPRAAAPLPAEAPPPLSPPPPERMGAGVLIGTSAATRQLREWIANLAAADAPVLIVGETGVGKEVVARALHGESPRRAEPFVAVNCGAIADSLLESELFGHVKGAFSGATSGRLGLFEEAGGGVVLLDEIGEIPPRLQVALLRVLESAEIRPVGSARPRRVACRILAATNADLDAMAAEGRFRRDLLFRLKRFEVRVSPLRSRREDILPLATHFLNEGRPEGVFAMMSARLCDRMRRMPWPGNVRQLRHAVERMRLIHSDLLRFDVEHFELDARDGGGADGGGTDPRPADSGGPRRDADSAARVAAGAAEREQAGARGQRSALSDAGGADGPALQSGRSSIRREETLLALFRRHRRLTRLEVARTLGVAPNTAGRDLGRLCRTGAIRRVAPSRSPRSAYFEIV